MSLFEIKAPIPSTSAETIDEILLENEFANWSVWQDVIAQEAAVVGIFETRAEAEASWETLRPLLADVGTPAMRDLPDTDWRNSYKAHFKAWRFGKLHWVPLWERDGYAIPNGEEVLWLDPGMAFGTGNHETTRLCCERLVAYAEENSARLGELRVIDAGCGSGILALSAAKLGFKNISGFDTDAEAIRISDENAALNELAGAVKFFVGDLISGLSAQTADLVLANIQSDVLMRFSDELLRAIAKNGTLVLSGILATELAKVREHFSEKAPSWSMEARTLGEWADIRLTHK